MSSLLKVSYFQNLGELIDKAAEAESYTSRIALVLLYNGL